VLPDVESADGFVSGWSERITGTQIETGTVPWADDLALLDLGASQAFTIVRAPIFNREQGVATAGYDDRVAIDLGAEGGRFGDAVGWPNVDPGRIGHYGLRQAAKVAPFAAGNEGVVRKSAAGDFCQFN